MMLMDDEKGLQQVEAESWTSWWIDLRACLGRKRTKKKKKKKIMMISSVIVIVSTTISIAYSIFYRAVD